MWLPLVFALVALAEEPGDRDEFGTLIPVSQVMDEPLFTAGGAHAWDRRIRERGWILRERGVYRMWYTGYDGSEQGRRMLGHARSLDGKRWERDPGGPVYGASWVEDVCVVKHRDRFYLFAEDGEHGLVWMSSRDGLRWQPRGPVTITSADGAERSSRGATPTVYVERGTWYLFYQGTEGVLLAAGRRPGAFRNVKDEPILRPGKAAHEKTRVAVDHVIKHRGAYFMLYHATGEAKVSEKGWSTNIARSSDLSNWVKFSGNPIIGGNKSSGIFVPHGGGYRIYTMHDRVDAFAPISPP